MKIILKKRLKFKLFSLLLAITFLSFSTSCSCSSEASNNKSGGMGLDTGLKTEQAIIAERPIIEEIHPQYDDAVVVEKEPTTDIADFEGYYYGYDGAEGEVYHFEKGVFTTITCNVEEGDWDGWKPEAGTYTISKQLKVGMKFSIKGHPSLAPTPFSGVWKGDTMVLYYNLYGVGDVGAVKLDVDALKLHGKWDNIDNWPLCP